jgi:trans-2,3-dihydro-3-hydroxyanthranilate isomerase
MSDLQYVHVDVFSSTPYGGNSLPIFLNAGGLGGDQMLRITKELRQFEAIFLEKADGPNAVRARIFDLFGELPFAGHPIIGAAAALHDSTHSAEAQTWRFALRDKTVSITTEATASGYFGLLDQGPARFLGNVDDHTAFAHAFDLELDDLHPDLPLEVVDTGLSYLIVPVKRDVLPRTRVRGDISDLLRAVNAQFAVLFDESAMELRHWNNDGVIEDTATGSAAGTIGAYCLRHTLARNGETFVLNQGRFTGRPSTMYVRPHGTRDDVSSVSVGGDVALVGRGVIEARP